MTAALNEVHNSFARCLGNERFFDRFYEIFMASDPAIQPMFARTDMVKQKHLLRHGLMSVLMYAEDASDATALMCLDRIRDTHGAKKLNIRPGLYRFWVQSLVQAVAESDPEWRPDLETPWREAVSLAVNRINAGY